MATLPQNVSALSDAEKFEMLDALWVDLESRRTGPTVEQAIELDRRLAAYRDDPEAVVAWETVKARHPLG